MFNQADINKSNNILDDLLTNLNITNKTIKYTEFAIFASLLSYFTIKSGKKDLEYIIQNPTEEITPKNYFKVDLAVGTITVIAAFYYFKLSKFYLDNSDCNDLVNLKSNKLNYMSTFLVLIAGLLKFYDVLFIKNNENVNIELNETIQPDLIDL